MIIIFVIGLGDRLLASASNSTQMPQPSCFYLHLKYPQYGNSLVAITFIEVVTDQVNEYFWANRCDQPFFFKNFKGNFFLMKFYNIFRHRITSEGLSLRAELDKSKLLSILKHVTHTISRIQLTFMGMQQSTGVVCYFYFSL